MDTLLTIIKLLGGLAMFLYGMEIMGDGLSQSSGSALKNFLGKLTHNPLLGLLTGTIVTAIIQSSTATIVLTVGLIGAGILNLRQAVSIVMGANIGTTVTAQIIRLMDIDSSGGSILAFFKPDTLAPLALIAGIILIMFIKKGVSKNIGLILVGFGVLFIGLISMTDAVEPLAESEAFVKILSRFSDMPILGILTGLVLTVIVQSSSAMVGILQALSSTGVMTFNLVYPIIMGINIGTCVTTAMVCSIGTQKDAKRTGIVHIVFNTIGTVLFMIVMPILQNAGAFPGMWEKIVNSGDIANFQTLFNVITAVLLVPFTNLLVKLSCRIIKDDPVKEDKYPELAGLDKNLMVSPAVALSEVAKSVVVMAKAAYDNFCLSLDQFDEYTTENSEDINYWEDRIDNFTDMADHYLVELSRHTDTDRENRELSMLMQCLPNIERIGDHATNFDELALKMEENKVTFSESARQELNIAADAVREIIRLTISALETENDEKARLIEPLEEVIDDMVIMLKDRHTARLCQGVCNINAGLVFMEILTNLERTADQCSNIAMLVLGKHNNALLKNQHQYLNELHASTDVSYIQEHEKRRQQYLVPLENIVF